MNKTKKITAMGMFAALAYVVMLICKMLPPMFSAFPFLSYDAKDVVIVVGGFVYGPIAAFMISLVVSVIEMLTVSDTNIIGCLMNVAAACAFACPASVVYSKVRSAKGAGIALTVGVICSVATMLILNYALTPLYMKIPRSTVVSLLVPAILPFNAIKYVLNASITLIIYKPFVKILRRTNLIEQRALNGNTKSNVPLLLAGVFLILVCMLAVFIING